MSSEEIKKQSLSTQQTLLSEVQTAAKVIKESKDFTHTYLNINTDGWSSSSIQKESPSPRSVIEVARYIYVVAQLLKKFSGLSKTNIHDLKESFAIISESYKAKHSGLFAWIKRFFSSTAKEEYKQTLEAISAAEKALHEAEILATSLEKNEKLQKLLAEKDEEIRNLKNSSKETEKNSLSTQQKLENTEIQLNNTNQENLSLKENVRALKEKFDDAEEKFNNQIKENKAEILKNKQEKSSFEGKFQEEQKLNSKLSSQITKLEQKSKTDESKIESQRKQIKELEAKLSEMQNSLENVQNESKNALESLKQEVSKKEEENKQLQKTIKEQNVQLNETPEEDLEKQLHAVEIKSLMEELEVLKQQQKQIDSSELHKEYEQLKQELIDKDYKVKRLTEQIENLQEQLKASFKSEEKDHSEIIKNLEEKIQNLQKQLSKTRVELQEEKDHSKSLQDEINTTGQKKSGMKEPASQTEKMAFEDLLEDYSRIKNENQKLKKDVQKLSESLKTKEGDIKDLHEQQQKFIYEHHASWVEYQESLTNKENLRKINDQLELNKGRLESMQNTLQNIKILLGNILSLTELEEDKTINDFIELLDRDVFQERFEREAISESSDFVSVGEKAQIEEKNNDLAQSNQLIKTLQARIDASQKLLDSYLLPKLQTLEGISVEAKNRIIDESHKIFSRGK